MPARPVTLTGANLLVLQHIACEPPGAYEDELLDRGGELRRVWSTKASRYRTGARSTGSSPWADRWARTRTTGCRGCETRSG